MYITESKEISLNEIPHSAKMINGAFGVQLFKRMIQ